MAASEEELTNEYKEKIVNFINNIQDWYNKSVNAVLTDAKQTYGINAKQEDVILTNIFVLFEQNEDELFGLEFRAEFDVEYGYGLKIKGKKDNYEIIKKGYQVYISSVGSWSVSIDAGAGKTINDAGQGNRYFQIVETDSINISAKSASKNTTVHVSLIKDGKVIKSKSGKGAAVALSHGINCR